MSLITAGRKPTALKRWNPPAWFARWQHAWLLRKSITRLETFMGNEGVAQPGVSDEFLAARWWDHAIRYELIRPFWMPSVLVDGQDSPAKLK